MFELDFGDLEQGEAMDRPNPLSDPGPIFSPPTPNLGLTAVAACTSRKVPHHLLLHLAGPRHAQAAVTGVEDNQAALVRVHALAAGARTRQAHAEFGRCSTSETSVPATFEAWGLCTEQEKQRCWDFCFCKWLRSLGGLRCTSSDLHSGVPVVTACEIHSGP